MLKTDNDIQYTEIYRNNNKTNETITTQAAN